MCPLFYRRRLSLPKEELLQVLLSYLPSGHTSFFSFVLWILKAFCSHPALTFMLAVTSSCLMHLPWSFFLNPFQHQQQKVVIHFHSIKSLKKFFLFSPLAPHVLPKYLLFGFFTLWFNILNHLKQKSTSPTNLETIFCIDSISPETVFFFFFSWTKWTQSR